MKLRTILPPQDIPLDISYSSQLLSLGSCFAEHIGQRLQSHLFNITINPFGIIYHPLPIAQSIAAMMDGKIYQSEDLFVDQGIYHSFAHHGQFSNSQEEVVLEKINADLQMGKEMLKNADVIFITLGTSWGYFHKDSGTCVANCHKVPQHQFEKRMSSIEDLAEVWEPLLSRIFLENPQANVVFSLSPIRHIKDGLQNNTLSKAILRLLIARLNEIFPGVHYFPAYEIMMDDLRDYRFYASDLLHPNELAVNYIWDYFQQHFLSASSKAQFIEIDKLIKAAEHRPFHSEQPAHQNFLQQQLTKIEGLSTQLAAVDFKDLQSKFEKQLVKSID